MNPAAHSSDTPGNPAHTAPAAAGLPRRLVTIAMFGYAAGLAVLFVGMEFTGESCWPLALLLYLPQRIFLLPLIVLIPAGLLVEVSPAAYAMLAGCIAIFLWHVPYYTGAPGPSGAVKLKLITNNYAQNHGFPIQPFIAAEDPDFVALEDVPGQGPLFRRAYPDRPVWSVGQFVFISKAPVKSATRLEWPRWQGRPVAAVFEVPWQGQDIAIYTVHLPTPRGDFAKLNGRGLLREMAGRNSQTPDGLSFAQAMTARVQLARDLAGVLAREQRPFLAVGDFNMPSDGLVHRIICRGLLDCFAKAGHGFGFTFPGDAWSPLTPDGPWLRIDYILAGPGWRANECRVEPGRRSEHRAVVATLSRD